MGEFAKWAEAQLDVKPEEKERPKIDDWRERADKQTQRLRKHVPLSAEVGTARATDALQQITSLLGGLGYKFRMQHHLESPDTATSVLPKEDPGIPGRDISIELPKEASWLEPRLFSKEAVGPIRSFLQDARVETRAKSRAKRKRALAPGTNPLTIPGFVPAAVIAAPESFRRGFTQADEDAKSVRNELLQAKLDEAKAEFEQALSEEYKGRKMASAGEWLDGLTKSVFALEKNAQSDQGEAMKWINAYLGMAALLGYGAHRASKRWTESRDPARQKHKLYRMALRQRMHDKGIPVVVDFNELPAGQAQTETTDELPVPEIKEAMVKRAAMSLKQILSRKVAPALPPLSHEYSGSLYRRLLETFKPVAAAKKKLAKQTGERYRPSLHNLPNIATPEQLNVFKVLTPEQKREIFYDVIGR